MTPIWRDAESVELSAGYAIEDAAGALVRQVDDVRVAIEGGFALISVPGLKLVQAVSAPAVHRIVYRPQDDAA